MIGVIADDVTGATDVAAVLNRCGLRTLLAFGLPDPVDGSEEGFDAIVVALKTRSVHSEVAVHQSLAALSWIKDRGANRVYFKYCSTFDSTPKGNIGPVTEALARALHQPMVITTPSSPAHGRTVYDGYLFVGSALLAESHMRDHPINPMNDSSTLRLLAAQSARPVGLLPLSTIRSGVSATREAILAARASGTLQLVADATSTEDLDVLAHASSELEFSAGAAGYIGSIAALVANPPSAPDARLHSDPSEPTAILAGSCSARTLEQISLFQQRSPNLSFFLDYQSTADAEEMASAALSWYDALPAGALPLVYSSLPTARLKRVQEELGVSASSLLFEKAHGLIAIGLVERGVTRLIAAGGETSGAIIDALALSTAEVEDELAAGVPWIHSRERGLRLALKSGNFGEPRLFVNVAVDHDVSIHSGSERNGHRDRNIG